MNIKASPASVYSFLGNKEPVYIQCVFYGYPLADVKMYDNKNQKVANGTEKAVYKLITDKPEMFETSYTCIAINSYGKMNHTMQLKFAGKKKVVCYIMTCLHLSELGGNNTNTTYLYYLVLLTYYVLSITWW